MTAATSLPASAAERDSRFAAGYERFLLDFLRHTPATTDLAGDPVWTAGYHQAECDVHARHLRPFMLDEGAYLHFSRVPISTLESARKRLSAEIARTAGYSLLPREHALFMVQVALDIDAHARGEAPHHSGMPSSVLSVLLERSRRASPLRKAANQSSSESGEHYSVTVVAEALEQAGYAVERPTDGDAAVLRLPGIDAAVLVSESALILNRVGRFYAPRTRLTELLDDLAHCAMHSGMAEMTGPSP